MADTNMDASFKNNQYKLGSQKNYRSMYDNKGNVSKELAKLIKENPDLSLPSNFKYLFNTITKRFMLKSRTQKTAGV